MRDVFDVLFLGPDLVFLVMTMTFESHFFLLGLRAAYGSGQPCLSQVFFYAFNELMRPLRKDPNSSHLPLTSRQKIILRRWLERSNGGSQRISNAQNIQFN